MKKLFFLSLFAPLLIAGCEDADRVPQAVLPDGGEGTGSLSVGCRVRFDVGAATRTSTDPLTYSLILDGPDGKVSTALPEDGSIKNLTKGSYNVTLTSHPDGIPAAAFDTPVYTASAENVAINAGQTTTVELVCTQVNAGIRFEYDPSLIEAGMLNVVPKVTQGGSGLEFVGKTKNSVGHFPAGEVTVTVDDAGNPVPIVGENQKTLQLKARQLWKIKLSAAGTRSDSGSGSARIICQTSCQTIN
jgi:hypothetical protein